MRIPNSYEVTFPPGRAGGAGPGKGPDPSNPGNAIHFLVPSTSLSCIKNDLNVLLDVVFCLSHIMLRLGEKIPMPLFVSGIYLHTKFLFHDLFVCPFCVPMSS